MFWVCKDKLVFCLCKNEGDWFIVVLASYISIVLISIVATLIVS
jgi:hypothetical protein